MLEIYRQPSLVVPHRQGLAAWPGRQLNELNSMKHHGDGELADEAASIQADACLAFFFFFFELIKQPV